MGLCDMRFINEVDIDPTDLNRNHTVVVDTDGGVDNSAYSAAIGVNPRRPYG